MSSKNISRRLFLQQMAVASAAIVLPSFLSQNNASGALNTASAKPRKIKPSEKVNLACIGIGNRGGEIIRDLYSTGHANVVALCDVDMGAKHTLKIMNQFADVPRFQDFRKMFDKMSSQIDAVCIGVPDHTHFPIAMMAIALGKHVYVEKPLGRTYQENALLIKAAKKYNNVVTQMGNQGHSEANYFQFKAWKEAGIIKDVTAITAHMNNPRRWHSWDPKITQFPSAQAIPDTLDWDTWLGACMDHGYNKDFVNGQWRCWYDYGMGALGDWGAHILDTAHEFLDLGLPYEINPTRLEGHNDFFYPMTSTILFRFPERKGMPACDVTWYDGLNNIPTVPDGYGVSELDPNIPPTSTGEIKPMKLNPGKIIYSKDLIFKGGSHGSTLSIIPEEKAKEMASQLPEVPQSTSNHYMNFLLACKGEEKARSPFEISGPLSQVFSLGVLAQRIGTKLNFDRQSERITNNSLADSLLSGPAPRPEWAQYYKV